MMEMLSVFLINSDGTYLDVIWRFKELSLNFFKHCSIVLLIPALMLNGCGQTPPEIVQASVTVTMGGKPLDKAEVRFFPMVPVGLDGSYMSSGITDDNGKFTLTLANQKPGVVVGEHQILIMETMPEEARGNSEDAQNIAIAYLQTLKNRPIPVAYSNLVQSPLKVSVTKDQNEYQIDIPK